MSKLMELAAEYRKLTGEDIFLYSSQPTPSGRTHFVFQNGQVFYDRQNAEEYLKLKIRQAHIERDSG